MPKPQKKKNTISILQKKALKLASTGKLNEAIDSMTSDMQDLYLLAKAPLSFDMIFAGDKSDVDRVQKKALKLARAGKLNEEAIDKMLLNALGDLSRIVKMGYIIGMATAMKEDPHLSRQRVENWIKRFGEKPLLKKEMNRILSELQKDR